VLLDRHLVRRLPVEHPSEQPEDAAQALAQWLRTVYAGDIAGGMHRAKPAAAARWFEAHAQAVLRDPMLACAVGDLTTLQTAIGRDPGWVHRAGGPLQLPPLVAIAHSAFLQLPAYRPRLHACAQALLAAGADPNQRVGSRWPPASPQMPSTHDLLSALYGAAGQNHDVVLTDLLLAAGADPNDGESLYHALPHHDCTRRLLQARARVVGSNALYRVLDFDDVALLHLLLAHGADANEASPSSDWPSPLFWALKRRRSRAHIEALLQAGADAHRRRADGLDLATLAWRLGLTEQTAVLRAAAGTTAPTAPTPAERFAAACAAADEETARTIQAQHPELPTALPPDMLRQLPEHAAQGCAPAVRCMVRLGWPVATTGGDWHASALNYAVFRGDAALAHFLLEHGAQWTEQHGFGDNCRGTLSWASCNTPDEDHEPGDWLGCAQALVAHGMPGARPDPANAQGVLVGGVPACFSEELTAYLLQVGAPG
jgi:hypothetical protein